LIVDDNDDIRDVMTILLRMEGFDVAPASGVEDAYRQLREGFRPCVVLLDVHMPGTDGWAFLDGVRSEPHLADVPVVIVSGDPDQRARARERACEFLLKPLRPDALLAAISRHCRQGS
jgi:CheY-like chemotaxis protein